MISYSHRFVDRKGADRQILLRGRHGFTEACLGKPHRRQVEADEDLKAHSEALQ